MISVQKPAVGILTQYESEYGSMFKVPCSCGCDSEVAFDLDIDDDTKQITAHIYATTKTNYWRERVEVTYRENWLVLGIKTAVNEVYNRIAIAYTALVKGYVQTESYVILSRQQALNLASTLESEIKRITPVRRVRAK
jgi:hypothetical protein